MRKKLADVIGAERAEAFLSLVGHRRSEYVYMCDMCAAELSGHDTKVWDSDPDQHTLCKECGGKSYAEKIVELVRVITRAYDAIDTLVNHPNSGNFYCEGYSAEIYRAVNTTIHELFNIWFPFVSGGLVDGPVTRTHASGKKGVRWYGEAEPEYTNELYRYFDSTGRLLYVGVSVSSIARQAQHRAGSAWYHKFDSMTVERYSTREEALEAERHAIIKEKPVHNVMHNGGPHD